MAKLEREEGEFVRNMLALTLTYLKAENDKTILEETLVTMIEYIEDEMRRLGLENVSGPSEGGE
jgi:hypothetical protein